MLKADVDGVVHKTDAGAVQLDLRTEADVRAAYRSLVSRFGGRLRRIGVHGLLLRVSRLADDLPEITDLDLNPVIACPDGVFAVDARVKVAPYQPQDPFLRMLR